MVSRALQTIYVMWIRDLKGFMRSKVRVVTTLVVPFCLLFFLAFGLNRSFMIGEMPSNISYLDFAVPGVIGMVMLFGTIFAGISVLWDKEFGFLKEIIVAPVSRWAIVVGRVAGGVTTGLIQGLLILLIALLMGFRMVDPMGLIIAIIFMILIGIGFVGAGVAIASILEDTQAFSLIMQFITTPAIFFSGAFFPLASMSTWMRIASFLDPLIYGIDGLRYGLIGVSQFPMYLNISVLVVFDILMVLLSSWFFSKTKG